MCRCVPYPLAHFFLFTFTFFLPIPVSCPRPLSFTDCWAGCITHLPFPFFFCPFVWAKGPKPPGCERGLKPGYTSLRAASQTQSAWLLFGASLPSHSGMRLVLHSAGGLKTPFKAGQEKTCVCQCLYLFICVHLRFLRHQRANDWSA